MARRVSWLALLALLAGACSTFGDSSDGTGTTTGVDAGAVAPDGSLGPDGAPLPQPDGGGPVQFRPSPCGTGAPLFCEDFDAVTRIDNLTLKMGMATTTGGAPELVPNASSLPQALRISGKPTGGAFDVRYVVDFASMPSTLTLGFDVFVVEAADYDIAGLEVGNGNWAGKLTLNGGNLQVSLAAAGPQGTQIPVTSNAWHHIELAWVSAGSTTFHVDDVVLSLLAGTATAGGTGSAKLYLGAFRSGGATGSVDVTYDNVIVTSPR